MYCSNFSSMKIDNSKKYFKMEFNFMHTCLSKKQQIPQSMKGFFLIWVENLWFQQRLYCLKVCSNPFKVAKIYLRRLHPKKIPRSCKIACKTIQRLWSVNLFVPWDYACENGTIPSFGFYAANFVITCHLLPWKTKLTTTKNWNLTHVTFKNHTMKLQKLASTNLTPWIE
jgi:hypothetical protein